jgi:hypothetical protein
VVTGYDTLGSGNFSNLRDHWFAKIWPKVERVPRKDTRHGVTLMSRSTDGASHPLNDGFSKELARCLLWFTRSSIVEASRAYLKEIPNATPEVARLDVVSVRKWKEKMYDGYVPSRQESARAIMKLQEKYSEENKAYLKDGFRSYFRKAVHRVLEIQATSKAKWKRLTLTPYPVLQWPKCLKVIVQEKPYVADTLLFGPNLKEIKKVITELEGLGYGLTREEGFLRC